MKPRVVRVVDGPLAPAPQWDAFENAEEGVRLLDEAGNAEDGGAPPTAPPVLRPSRSSTAPPPPPPAPTITLEDLESGVVQAARRWAAEKSPNPFRQSRFGNFMFARLLLFRENVRNTADKAVVFEKIRDCVVELDRYAALAERDEERISSAQQLMDSILLRAPSFAFEIADAAEMRARVAGRTEVLDSDVATALELSHGFKNARRELKQAKNMMRAIKISLERTRANEVRQQKMLEKHEEHFNVLVEESRAVSQLSSSMNSVRRTDASVERILAKRKQVQDDFNVLMEEERERKEHAEVDFSNLEGEMEAVDADANIEEAALLKSVTEAVKMLVAAKNVGDARTQSVGAGNSQRHHAPTTTAPHQPPPIQGPGYYEAQAQWAKQREAVRSAASTGATPVEVVRQKLANA